MLKNLDKMNLKALTSQFVFKRGDVNGAVNLFFDNLATLISIIFLLNVLLRSDDLNEKLKDPTLGGELGSVKETIDDIIFVKTVPGLAMTMVFGNFYYTIMGLRVGAAEGREPGTITALPYGVNTPAAFVFLFGVILPAYLGAAAPCEDLPFTTPEEAQVVGQCYSDAALYAWKAGVVANFMVGVISVVLGFVGPLLLKVTPISALLVSLAGIGFAFLGIQQVAYSFKDPVSGLLPLFMMFVFFFGDVSMGMIPKSLVIVTLGTVIAWADGVQSVDALKEAAELVQVYGLSTGFSAFDSFSSLGDSIGTVLPIAFAAASNTLMNVISAKKAGDSYGPVETMVSDGVGTIIAAFFGTPFGTSVYIGHPAYKKMGAGVAYSIVNCTVYFFFAIFGIFSVVNAVIPPLAVAPILLFVGLTITQEAFESGPVRHYPGIVFGLIPSVVDLMLNKGASDGYGYIALKPSAIMLSMFFAAIAIYSTDRKFLHGGVWSVAAAILSAFGLLHQESASLDVWNTAPQGGTDANTAWRYMLGWLLVAVFMFFMYVLQRKEWVQAEIEDDVEQEAEKELVEDEKSPKVDAASSEESVQIV